MYEAIETSRIINAFLRCVPGTFVRDYVGTGGFLQIRRGRRLIASNDSNEVYETAAETLCTLNPGWTPRTTFVKGVVTKNPGWQVQMRVAGKKLSPYERRKIEKHLGFPIFDKVGHA